MAGIYIHVPFCARRCAYCDFYSTTLAASLQVDYVNALCREIALRRNEAGGDRIETVYLGGGTPSLLAPLLLGRIFDAVWAAYDVVPEAEVTLEANPDDLSDDYVARLRELPINRLSLGVQTFSDPLLRLLGRRHTAAQALCALERCRRAGFDNLSLDLMFGLPGQTLEDWEADLARALGFGPAHLSAYSLSYEEGTRLWQMRGRGQVAEAPDDLSRAMYERLIDRTQAAGMEHYEISNFARPGRRARHNAAYWHGVPYLGFGAAAHSYSGTSRRWNVADVRRYIVAAGCPPHGGEQLDARTRYNEMVMTALRTVEGLDLKQVELQFGSVRLDELLCLARPHLQRGLLQQVPAVGGQGGGACLRLTRAGLFVSDDVMSDLLCVDETAS